MIKMSQAIISFLDAIRYTTRMFKATIPLIQLFFPLPSNSTIEVMYIHRSRDALRYVQQDFNQTDEANLDAEAKDLEITVVVPKGYKPETNTALISLHGGGFSIGTIHLGNTQKQ
jgi:hypothetical protein